MTETTDRHAHRHRVTRVPRHMLVVVGVGLFGVLMRMSGWTWGLPERFHPDEFVIVDGALDLAHRGSFEPSYYFRPDHVEIQLNYIAYTLYSHLFMHMPVEAAYDSHPGRFLLISRAITTVFGIAMIVLAYLIGRRFNTGVATIAVVLFSLFPLFVENSMYATPDVPLTAMLMGVVLACMRYLRSPRYPSLLWASACISVSIAIKFPGAIATIMIAVVVIFAGVRDHAPWRIVRHGCVSIIAVIGFLFAISPVLFTNVREVRRSIREESRSTHPGSDGLSPLGNLHFYADQFLSVGGVAITVLFVVGAIVAVRRRMTETIPIQLGLIFWIALSMLPLHWDRWGLPMFITPLLLASIGINYGYMFLRRRGVLGRWLTPVSAVIAAVVLANMVVNSGPVVARYVAGDSRFEYRSELARQGATPQNTAYEGYSPFLPGTNKEVFKDFAIREGRLVPTNPRHEFVLLSGCSNGRYRVDPRYAEQQEFFRRVGEQFDLIDSVGTVALWQRTAIEPLNIIRSRRTLVDYASGGVGGCALDLYRIPPDARGSAERE